jgi:hypothetical protein
MAAELELTIGFAANGNSLGYLGGGWARAEPEFTWATGSESHLMLVRSKGPGDYILTLDVIPFVCPPELATQRLTLTVNDTVVGTSLLDRPTLLGYRIPESLMRAGDRILITLLHLDAARPVDLAAGADDRLLAFSLSEARLYRLTDEPTSFAADLPRGLMLPGDSPDQFRPTMHDDELAAWVHQHTGMSLAQLAMQFESLGENCEFGLVQRRCEAEPLGLLRFSSTFLRNLLRGLDSGFAGLGEIADVEPRLEGEGPEKEYMVHEQRYGLVYHTFVYEAQRSAWLVREQEAARLKFLRRKFLEELELSEKIFVYKRNLVAEEEILPLLLALNRHGRNRLLWVVPACHGRPPGSVEVVMPGLLKGYIDRFAPEEDAHAFSFATWIRLCINAWLLSRLDKSAV